MDQQEEKNIISEIRNGNQEIFKELIERYKAHVFRIVYSILQHSKDAEDVTQDVFIQIYLSLPQYKNQGLKTWISKIAVHKAIDQKRKAKKNKEELVDVFHQETCNLLSKDNVEDNFFEEEKRKHIQSKMKEIPSNYQHVMHAYYIQGKSYQEIAREQGVAIKSIESKLYRAKKWIRKHWRRDEWI